MVRTFLFRVHIRAILIVAIAISVLLALPTAGYAADFTVTKTADTADGTCDGDCSLREAVIAANANSGADTITVPAGTYVLDRTGSGENAADTGDLDITDASGLTITGADQATTIIDGNATDRVFDVPGSADISNLTIQNGSVTDVLGGGVYVDGTLTLDNVVIENNLSDHSGGGFSGGAGIQCYTNGDLTLTNSTVQNNGSGTDAVYGGGLSYLECDLVVTNTTFSGNSGELGGGMYLQYGDAPDDITMTDVTISENSATDGGGFYMYRGSGSGTPTSVWNRVTIDSNTATGDGGGAYIDGPASMMNTTVIDNEAVNDGGGIFVANDTDSAVELSFSTIVRNYADSDDNASGEAGGFFIEGSNADVDTKGVIVGQNFEGDPDGDPGDWVDKDCEDGSGGYGLSIYDMVRTTTNCAPSTQANDLSTIGWSVYYTANLSDMGGEVPVQAAWVADMLDTIPGEDCTDVTNTTTITSDARGLTRPDNSSCEPGAFEADQTDPVVTATVGSDTVECNVNTWVDAGATVTDNFSSGLTASTSDTVDESSVGEQTITYTSTADHDGNTGTVGRVVTVSDTLAPDITVTGDTTQTLTVGDTYTDQGATATDTCDTAVSVVTGGDTVDTTTAGMYTVRYTASDASGNAASEATRVVTVLAETSEEDDNPDNGDQEGGEDTTETLVSLTTNGKYVRIFENGEKVAEKKIGNKKLKRKFYGLKTKKMFPNKPYWNVVVLTARKNKATVTVLRITGDNQLKKKVAKSFDINKRNTLKLKVNTDTKKITATVGKGKSAVKVKYKLTKKGKLKRL